jgi:hypothetical protein
MNKGDVMSSKKWGTSISLHLKGLTLRVSKDRQQLVVNTGESEFHRELSHTEWAELLYFIRWTGPALGTYPDYLPAEKGEGKIQINQKELLPVEYFINPTGLVYEQSINTLVSAIDREVLFAYPSLPDYEGRSNRQLQIWYLSELFFKRFYYLTLGKKVSAVQSMPYAFDFLNQTPCHNMLIDEGDCSRDVGLGWINHALSKVVKKLEEMPDESIYQWGYVPHYINYMAYDTNAVEKCFFEGVNVAWGFMQKPMWLIDEGQDKGQWVGAESFVFGRAQEIASIYDVPMNNVVPPHLSLEERPKPYFFDIYFELPQEYDVTIKSVDTHIWLSRSTVLSTPFKEYTRLTIKIYSKAEFKKAIDHITETYGDCVYQVAVNQVWEEMNGKVV